MNDVQIGNALTGLENLRALVQQVFAEAEALFKPHRVPAQVTFLDYGDGVKVEMPPLGLTACAKARPVLAANGEWTMEYAFTVPVDGGELPIFIMFYTPEGDFLDDSGDVVGTDESIHNLAGYLSTRIYGAVLKSPLFSR